MKDIKEEKRPLRKLNSWSRAEQDGWEVVEHMPSEYEALSLIPRPHSMPSPGISGSDPRPKASPIK